MTDDAISIFISAMKDSIADNMLIINTAIINTVILLFSFIFAIVVSKYYNNPNEKDLKKHLYYVLDISYTFFIGIIHNISLTWNVGNSRCTNSCRS